jgi:hypothetical protein
LPLFRRLNLDLGALHATMRDAAKHAAALRLALSLDS